MRLSALHETDLSVPKHNKETERNEKAAALCVPTRAGKNFPFFTGSQIKRCTKSVRSNKTPALVALTSPLLQSYRPEYDCIGSVVHDVLALWSG